MKLNPPDMKLKPTVELVTRKITVKRQGGKIVSLVKDYDPERKIEEAMKLAPPKSPLKIPFMKSAELKFSHNGDVCSVEQKISYMMTEDKIEAEVNYDRELCRRLFPLISQKETGDQDEANKRHLISLAELAYSERNKDLAKEGKQLRNWTMSGAKAKPDAALETSMDLGAIISGCAEMGEFVRPGNVGAYVSPSSGPAPQGAKPNVRRALQ